MKFLKQLRRNEEGATAIEYGLIAALIAVAAITAMTALGEEVEETFSIASTEMEKGNAKGRGGE